ncbi:unnamed protein product [Rotaria sordida]|uniref:G-protein coupled receptors family 1 profile domain-containing protein n=1 Tax=Rotaria sordida TaxID=392033 RepID=A0A819V2N7_9BILA|nr:unnamed protein product [Rotaria sordida]
MSSTAQLIVTISQTFMTYTGFLFLFLGVIGNMINIIVLNKLRLFRGHPSVFYFTIESIGNLAQLIINYTTRIMSNGFGIDLTNISWEFCKTRAFLAPTATLIPIYTVCLACFDQFLSTHYNPFFRQKSSIRLAKYLTFTFITLLILHGIPFVIFFYLQPSMTCKNYNVRFGQYYSFVYYPVVVGILPMTIASLFSFLAFRHVRHLVRRQLRITRRRLEQQLTAMVLARAICLGFLMLPYTIYRIYILNVTVDKSQLVLSAINNTLIESVTVTFLYINFAGNFYIFMAISSRYRHQVKHVLVKKFWFRWKYWLRFCIKCGAEDRIAPEIDHSNELPVELE